MRALLCVRTQRSFHAIGRDGFASLLLLTSACAADAPPCDAVDGLGRFACAELPTPCPSLYLEANGTPTDPSLSGASAATTLDDVRCVLTALRDDTVGTYTVFEGRDPRTPRGLAGRYRRFHLLGDGTIVTEYKDWYDLVFNESTGHATTRDAAFFDGCLTASFGSTLFTCVTQPTQGTPTTCASCPVVSPTP